jgi:hypothetical protein
MGAFTWQQWFVGGYICILAFCQMCAIAREDTGREAFIRLVFSFISPVGIFAALYTAGFWEPR